MISNEELSDVNGGNESEEGYFMTVSGSIGGYLALRPQPCWDQYHEIARLLPGYQVFTYGATTSGTGMNGVPCTYIYVNFNGYWGYADMCFLD